MAFKPRCTISCCDCNGETCKSPCSANKNKEKGAGESLRKIDLGPAPSPVEVDEAVTALLSFLQGIFSYDSMSKWLQPVLDHYDSSILHSDGYQWVCKAFQWLRTDPFFKRLVISLCLDKAVWDAIVQNEVMGKLQVYHSSGGNGKRESSNEGPDLVRTILRWILDLTQKKIMELIEGFLILVNTTFRFPGREKLEPENRDQIEEKVQSSIFLSLVVLLIVVVARAQIA